MIEIAIFGKELSVVDRLNHEWKICSAYKLVRNILISYNIVYKL